MATRIFSIVVLLLMIASELRAQDTGPTPGQYNKQGVEAYGQGRFREAIDLLSKAVALKPDYKEAFFNLGSAYNRTDQLEKARDALAASIKIDPDYSIAHNLLGVVLTKLSDYDGAIKALNRASSLKPGWSVPYFNLGNIYIRLEDFQAAASELEKARERAPDDPEVRLDLGYAYGRQKRLVDALVEARKAVDLRPHDYLSLLLLTKLYMNTNDRQSAIAEYRLVESFDPAIAEKLKEMIFSDKLVSINDLKHR